MGRSRSGSPAVRADWMAAAASAAQFPPPGAPEVAFLGRSNVGKSSLLNRLVQRKGLAKTSSTPGKTRLLHWYAVERKGRDLWLVDLPGYGYAKVSRREREKWQPLVESYLGDRPTLRAAVLLQDLRRDWSEDESLLVAWLAERDVPVLVALTKCDKLKPMRRAERVRVLKKAIGLPKASVVATSAQSGDGVEDLWAAIFERL
ncbi:MAG: ribosome biogenesis GTP-binding protein YihA/YsxC [Myxococcota bacterium]